MFEKKSVMNFFIFLIYIYSHFFPTHSEEGENVKLSPMCSLRNGR